MYYPNNDMVGSAANGPSVIRYETMGSDKVSSENIVRYGKHPLHVLDSRQVQIFDPMNRIEVFVQKLCHIWQYNVCTVNDSLQHGGLGYIYFLKFLNVHAFTVPTVCDCTMYAKTFMCTVLA